MKNGHYAGIMLSEVPFLNIPVLFAGAGLDFLMIDTEHGGFDYGTLSGLIMNARLSGLRAFIRLPDNQRRDITRMMDMGADGLLLPMTNTAEDIAQVVKYAKYSPVGQRGISTTRAHTGYFPPDLQRYMCQANERTMVFAQIETKMGVNNIQEILAVEGVSGAFVGPNDLSCDMGCIGEKEPIVAAIRQVGQAAAAQGKHSGVITADKLLLSEGERAGMRWFSIGSELNMLKSGCKAVIETVHHMAECR